MRKNKIFFICGVIMLTIMNILLVLAYASALHNVDLSWNAKHLDLIDCNGIICEDIEVYYQNSMMNLWFLPVLIGIINLVLGAFLGRLYRQDESQN